MSFNSFGCNTKITSICSSCGPREDLNLALWVAATSVEAAAEIPAVLSAVPSLSNLLFLFLVTFTSFIDMLAFVECKIHLKVRIPLEF